MQNHQQARMPYQDHVVGSIVAHCTATIEQNRDVLTQLDQAIGDGDHGINMSRGFAAVQKAFDQHRDEDFPELCKALGLALVMNVGGASGPLFGSMIFDFGDAATRFPQNRYEAKSMLAAGIDAVKSRGKSDVGAKTMLDVLVPICETLDEPGVTLGGIRACAERSLEETREMIATKGRSAFLGERSRGHLDPGAKSVCLLVNAVCDVLEDLS